MSELAGYLGAYYFTSDTSTGIVEEAVGTADGSATDWTLDHSNVDFSGLTVTVAAAAQEQNVDYIINPNGTLVFTAAPVSDAAIVASYNFYSDLVQAGGFIDWSFDVSGDVLDTTNFESTGWRTFKAGLKGWSGSANRHWQSNIQGNMSRRAIMRFYTDETNSDYYIGFGIVNGLSPSVSADALVDEGLSFQGTGQMFLGN